MNNIDSFIKENGLTIVNPTISTTYSIIQTMVTIIDIKILIPIDKEFVGIDMYKLTNCLKVKHRGNPQGMQQNILLIQQYIKEKSLTSISSLYTVNLNKIRNQDELDKY